MKHSCSLSIKSVRRHTKKSPALANFDSISETSRKKYSANIHDGAMNFSQTMQAESDFFSYKYLHYTKIHGAKKRKICEKKKRIASPIIIFVAHSLSFRLYSVSSLPAIDHATPKAAITRTPARIARFMSQAEKFCTILRNPHTPGSTIH